MHRYYVEDGKKEIVFDFSLLKSIDANVIPNLLCVGFIIRENSKFIPSIYVPDNLNSGALKRYLNDINFVRLARDFGLFNFNSGIDCGWSDKGMDKHNTTIFFNSDESENDSWSKLIRFSDKFAQKYLNEFYQDINYINPNNTILDVSKEIIQNSKEHGRSFVFMTIQYNYKLERVYLSYADCGIGFLSSFIEKEKFLLTELDGIIEGIYARVDEKSYGLYSVINKVLPKGGVIRVHSNNTQLILTHNTSIDMNIADTADKLKKILKLDSMKGNVRNDLKYAGVHIEIEIPLSKEEVKRNV